MTSFKLTVRKDADDVWTVVAETCSGAIDLLSFPCQGCAEAAAHDLTNTFGSATCPQHNRSQLTYPTLLDAAIGLLRFLMGLGDQWDKLNSAAKHRIEWVARLLLEGERDWDSVIAAWEHKKRPDLGLNGLVSYWFAEVTLG